MGILKKIFDKKAKRIKSVFEKKPDPVDQNLPLNIKFNSIIEFDKTLFLLNENLNMKFPGKKNIVKGIGKSILFDHLDMYQFYLESEEGNESTLQIIKFENDKQLECRLLRTLDEEFPSNDEEWDFWLNDENGSIGLDSFKLKNAEDNDLYSRTWDDNGPEHINPIFVSEKIYLDKYDDNPVETKHDLMLYSKAINDDQLEYILVSAEEDKNSSMVRISTGIDVEPMSITII